MNIHEKIHTMNIFNFNVLIIFMIAAGCSPKTQSVRNKDSRLGSIKLPEGFSIDIYAQGVKNARSMVLSPSGTLFVGSREKGNVYAVLDTNSDFIADKVITIAEKLNSPNGVAFKDGDLYVAEISRILKFDDIENQLQSPPGPVVVYDELPEEGHHGWKYIAFGPDGKLYVPVGAPCNICLSDQEIFASIGRMDADGSNFEIFVHGIRNTVGFDWHPGDNVLWFTENGRDWMGDNRPPDELNRAPEAGMHFGYPFCHGQDIPDNEFGSQRNCNEFVKPVQDLGPHVAALGMKFYTGNMFPDEYRQQIFIAEHGSWNRTTPLGYRVMLVKLNGNTVQSYSVFAEGWLQGGSAWGRPVDIVQLSDGSLLVSDDKADMIYRISYTGKISSDS